MRCAGCRRELDVGDQYIEGTANEYLKRSVDPAVGGLIAEIMPCYEDEDD